MLDFIETLSTNKLPYIIAEIGANHNGDMELARKLIIAAKEAGADAVKFQSWTKNSIFIKEKYKENFFLKDDYRNRSDETLESIIEKYSVSEQQLLEMKLFADKVGIDFSSTPFSNQEIDFLADTLKVKFIKVASMDLNNYPFLEYIAKKNLPIILSTGLSELYEIDKAIRTIENSGNNKIVILHCVSIYPPNDIDVNLNNIDTLAKLYPYPIGFSDHTLGSLIPLAAVVKGVKIIEKHFTLDKNLPGWDHKVSATPKELEEIVVGAKRIINALGSNRIKSVESNEQKIEFRRSVVAARKIYKGEVIEKEDIVFKRPGRGLPPEAAEYIIGKSAKRTIEEDTIIVRDDF